VQAALALIPWIMKLLQGIGLVKDPEQERELRLKLIDVATQRDVAESQEFAAFMKATSPDAAYVWTVINSITALTRPAITWLIMGSIIASFWKPGLANQITDTLSAFSNAGTAGLLFLAIPAWWFFGRSIEKIVPGLSLLRANGNENGRVESVRLPDKTREPDRLDAQ